MFEVLSFGFLSYRADIFQNMLNSVTVYINEKKSFKGSVAIQHNTTQYPDNPETVT